MATIEMQVRSVVESFLKSGERFTALDVSNKVKMALPFARHREVRDVVRGLFTTDIEPAGWARTPINVTLPDGSTAEALLYHPLSDSWDLDSKYDAQKRQQASVHSGSGNVPTVVPVVASPSLPPPASVAVPNVVVQAQVLDMWNSLFDNKPSLFPRK